MFPIRDTIRARTFPVINWLLIAINVLVFLFETSLGPRQLEQLVLQYGLVPANINPSNPLTWFPILSHMFLHGGWFHLLSNVWMLVIFGDNVEDRMGSGRYLSFYLLGGVAAAFLQSYLSPDKTVPAIGASGAIAAVLGAYILFFPRARVITMVLLILIPFFIEIPAVIFLGVWFVSQLYSGLLALASNSAQWSGVAWWAHIGGFLFGLLMARIFTLGRRTGRWYPDEYYPW